MIKTYKYRIYPTGKQTKAIDAMLETHRHIYNNALYERTRSWEENKKSVSFGKQSALHTIERKSNEYYQKTNAHKIARQLISNYDVIAIEDMKITNMLKNHHIAKSISDAGWHIFTSILIGKAEEAGREVVKVDPKYTSQICSGCGIIVKKSLSVRIHSCPHCGLVLDRDVNAAINILSRAGILPSGVNVEVANSSVS